jgi:hypothetical protein
VHQEPGEELNSKGSFVAPNEACIITRWIRSQHQRLVDWGGAELVLLVDERAQPLAGCVAESNFLQPYIKLVEFSGWVCGRDLRSTVVDSQTRKGSGPWSTSQQRPAGVDTVRSDSREEGTSGGLFPHEQDAEDWPHSGVLSYLRDLCPIGDRPTFVEVLKRIPMAAGGKWVWQPDKPVRPAVRGRPQAQRGRGGFRPPVAPHQNMAPPPQMQG